MRYRHLPLLSLLLPASLAAQESNICLAPATVEASPSGSDPATAVRETFASFLTGPTLGVTPLNARLESQVRQEAKLAECRYLLLTSIKHERKSGGGLLRRMAGGAAEQGAYSVGAGASGTAERVAAGAAAGAARTAATDYAHNFQARDELTLTWRLEGEDGKELKKGKEKSKADANGQDLLTPMVQQAAEAIAATVS